MSEDLYEFHPRPGLSSTWLGCEPVDKTSACIGHSSSLGAAMLLTRLLRRLAGAEHGEHSSSEVSPQPRVLCIGGQSELGTMPYHYTAWNRDLLSEHPAEGARFVKSTLRLTDLDGASYDAVYHSHLLKNHSLYDGGLILHGIRHLLKPGGFLHLKVPDVLVLMEQMVKNGHDLEYTAYTSGLGPISYHDVFWGLGTEVAGHGSNIKGHKAGYSRKVLARVLSDNGFRDLLYLSPNGAYELEVIAAVERLHENYRILLGLNGRRSQS